MAQYDYIRLTWSHSCNIVTKNGTVIYYVDGFENVRYFGKDDNLNFPDYNIEDDSKESAGTNKVAKQTWKKYIQFNVKVAESVVDALSLIPLHDHVTLTDKDGNAYVASGYDCIVDITPAEAMDFHDGVHYPIMSVNIGIPADFIFKTSCCSSITELECSDTVPTLSAADVSVAGVMTLTGTAPDNMLIRALYREWIEKVQVGNGVKINDVCFVSATVAYCCSSLGGIYKTTDGGKTWAIKYPGSVQLNGICYDGTSKIYAVGDVVAGQGLCVVGTVGVDTFAQVNTAKNENLLSVSFSTNDAGYCCGVSGCVLFFDGAAWSDKTPGPVTVLRDITTIPGTKVDVVAVGLAYICHSSDGGATWTITNYAGEDFNACVFPLSDNGKIYVGNTLGDISYSANKGVTLTILVAGAGTAILGLDKATVGGVLYVYAINSNGRVYYDAAQANTFANSWHMKSITTCKRIRAFTGASHELLVATGGVYVGTTETAINNGNAVTYIVYNSDGVDVVTAALTTYEVAVQTFLLNSDPCETCATQLFTSHS